MIETMAFDFDGVILESARMKTDAFRELFRDRPERLEEIVAYHVRHAGVSRYRKFEVIYGEILRVPLTEGESRALGDKFSSLAFEKVLRAPFVRGACEFLEEFSSRLPLYVVSGTPASELLRVVEARGLARFFRGVFGSPDPKAELLFRIKQEQRIANGGLLVVGDGRSDLDSALAAGAKFVGRVPEGGPDPFTDAVGIPRVTDLADRRDRWEEITGEGGHALAC